MKKKNKKKILITGGSGFIASHIADQLSKIVEAVGDDLEIILDGGIRRGNHILKALSLGASACSGGRLYLYALAAGGQLGVEKALFNLKLEIIRNMKLMGVNNISALNSRMIRKNNYL